MTSKRLILASLLQFLVLPGAGHFFVKKKLRGGIIAGVTIVVALVFGAHLVLLIKSQMGTLPAPSQDLNDMLAVANKVGGNMAATYKSVFDTYIYIFGALYIGGFVDLVYLYIRGNRESHS